MIQRKLDKNGLILLCLKQTCFDGSRITDVDAVVINFFNNSPRPYIDQVSLETYLKFDPKTSHSIHQEPTSR